MEIIYNGVSYGSTEKEKLTVYQLTVKFLQETRFLLMVWCNSRQCWYCFSADNVEDDEEKNKIYYAGMSNLVAMTHPGDSNSFRLNPLAPAWVSSCIQRLCSYLHFHKPTFDLASGFIQANVQHAAQVLRSLHTPCVCADPTTQLSLWASRSAPLKGLEWQK